MDSQGPDEPREAASADDAPGSAGETEVVARERASVGQASRALVLRALLAGLLAGLATWGVDEVGLLRVAPQRRAVNTMGTIVSAETTETRSAALLRTAALTYGFLGAAVGVALGVAGGLRVGPVRLASAVAAGLLLGALAGGILPFAVIPLYVRAVEGAVEELVPSILMHWGLWTLIGAAGGLALGVGLGGRARAIAALCGGALGAIVGTVLYDLIGALALPLDETGQPFSATRLSHLLCFVLVATSAAVGAGLLARGR